MKIGIYNPYFDSLGGGERYLFTLAEHWSKNHGVSVFWNDPLVIQQAEDRFGLDLSRVTVTQNFFLGGNIIRKLAQSHAYDLIVFLNDGSVPTSLARYNMLHFQVPFAHVFMPVWKAIRYQAIVCNSTFTKDKLDLSLRIPRSVIYPPVDVEKFTCGKKAKTILTVGRFNGLFEAKKQDVLINAFRNAIKKKQFQGWKLVMAGGVLPTDISYFEKLQQAGAGLPIEFHPNCSFSELKEYYSTASIYWHAAGFGETKPEHMEHFGISTVEAMASGCLPIVFAGGGQPEIVIEEKNGYLWKTEDELIRKTLSAIRNKEKMKKLVTEAKKTSVRFSKEQFAREFDNLLVSVCK